MGSRPASTHRHRTSRSVAAAALVVVTGCSGAASSPSGAAPRVAEGTTATRAPTTTLPTTTLPTTTLPPTTLPPTTLPPTTLPTTTPLPLDRADAATLDRLLGDIAVLVDLGPRVQGSAAERAGGDLIAQRLRALTGAVESMRVELPNGLGSRTLWVTIGDHTGGPWTLLGAHYDTVTGSPGADDNASGTAVLLEMVARLVEVPPRTGAVSLMFFGAEEVHPGFGRDDHHYGSRQWVEARQNAGSRLPDLMVSVDMVGVGADLYAVAYRGTSVSAVDALVAAGESVAAPVARLDRGDISDHEPFALAGVPAAMLWRPSNPDYHRPTDTDVVADRVHEVMRIVERLVADRHG